MTEHEHKLIERGHDNDMLALIKFIREDDFLYFENGQWRDECPHALTDQEILQRFKNRNK